MEIEIPWSLGEENATIFVTDYDGNDFNYEVVVGGFVVDLDKKQDLKAYKFALDFLDDYQAKYEEYLLDDYLENKFNKKWRCK